jgi:hypothetical protein
MVTTYAPMDAGEDAAKDAFYLMLFACLKGAPIRDKLIVIGDFNVELGSACDALLSPLLNPLEGSTMWSCGKLGLWGCSRLPAL